LPRALHLAARADELAARSEGAFRVIRSRADLAAYEAARRLDPGLTAGLLAIEGAHALDGDPANVEVVADAGFRMMSPSHFFDNAFGGSAHGIKKGGLTDAGREMLERMEARRMLVDVAHASAATIDDTLALATRPVVASHTGFRGVADNARNLTDDHARGIAGGQGLTDLDQDLLARSRQAFGTVGGHLSASRFKFAINEAMRTVAEANKYFSEQAPWKLRESDPERMRSVLHVALQLVDDAKTLLTPFLPRSSQQVHTMLGGTGTWSDMPRVEEVDEAGGPSYPVITGTYDSTPRWASVPLRAGTPLAAPKPLFAKLDTSVVDEELARLGA
jgi:hypothetical protein